MPMYILAALTVISLSASSLLVIRQWQFKRQLTLVTARIEEIRNGNINQRIRISTTQNSLNELGGCMNRLIDEFQRSMDKVNLLESERKKMISHLSHDLRTPLTAIMGYVEVMQRDETLTIIHIGKLVEEIEQQVLQMKNRHCVEFKVSNDRQAVMLLEQKLGNRP